MLEQIILSSPPQLNTMLGEREEWRTTFAMWPPGRLFWPRSPALPLCLSHYLSPRSDIFRYTNVAYNLLVLKAHMTSLIVNSVNNTEIDERKCKQYIIVRYLPQNCSICERNSITTLPVNLRQPCRSVKMKMCQSHASAAPSPNKKPEPGICMRRHVKHSKAE